MRAFPLARHCRSVTMVTEAQLMVAGPLEPARGFIKGARRDAANWERRPSPQDVVHHVLVCVRNSRQHNLCCRGHAASPSRIES